MGRHSLSGDQREEPIRTQKETNRARRTYLLETTEGGTSSQGTEGKQQARGTHELDATEGGTGQDGKESDRERGNHQLETARERQVRTHKIKSRDGHSQTEDRRGGGKSGHGKKPIEGHSQPEDQRGGTSQDMKRN